MPMNIFTIILLLFISPLALCDITFPKDFIFAVANAPGQVEDGLKDIWLSWGNQGKIRAWKNVPQPEKRLEFWTRPEVELDLAQKLGVHSFRLGIDWERVMPAKNQFNETAILRYREILQMIRKRGMRVMLTLMHHSVPKWIQDQDGWHNQETIKDFVLFSQKMIKEYHADVDWWLTFNEGNIFVTMAYTAGIWPPGEKRSPLSLGALGYFRGKGIKAMDRMTEAHIEIFDWAHKNYPSIKMGVAHNMANYAGKNFINRLKATVADENMNWRFPENIRGKMDFFGFNYYGAEWLKGNQVDIDPTEEYSEAGRAIDVNGLYDILKKINQKFPGLPIIVTENGIADAQDAIRPSYLIEHLHAVHKAIQEKVPILGYYVWSLTDNLEWSDGYCPKFGLVEVNRMTMERKPRLSFEMYQTIIKTRSISHELRSKAWKRALSYQGKDRPFCRDKDGITAYDVPRPKKFIKKDWRFSR